MTLAVNGNHLLDYDEILYSLCLMDGEYSGDISVSNFLCHAYNSAIN